MFEKKTSTPETLQGMLDELDYEYNLDGIHIEPCKPCLGRKRKGNEGRMDGIYDSFIVLLEGLK